MILACDPGVTGALACLDETNMTLLSVVDMPTFIRKVNGGDRRQIDTEAVGDWLIGHKQLGCRRFIIEHVQGLPGQGAPSAFNFGYGFGYILGAARLLGYETALARPQVWLAHHHLNSRIGGKSSSLNKATKLMPANAGSWRLKKDHGRAEAALIAWYAAETIWRTK